MTRPVGESERCDECGSDQVVSWRWAIRFPDLGRSTNYEGVPGTMQRGCYRHRRVDLSGRHSDEAPT